MSVFLIIFYVFAFLAVYVQVFLLLTFFEHKKDIFIRTEDIELDHYPTVTVIVPCYNEQEAVLVTVDSLLNLNYDKDKLSIFVVDDGSKDNTWNVLQKYVGNPQIKLFKKENGGKHTALNFGLERTNSEFVGCLDSDSSVHPESLKRIITFFKNEKTMAVVPSIIVRDPKNIIQYAQRAEYDMAHYTKKMLAFLKGIHVTPGPFSIFRKKVFDQIGNYRKAHHTEDQEIALRMHKHGLEIDYCTDAFVYTGGPDSIPKLFRQRVRWVYGFLRNARDYRGLIFRNKYGTVGIFTIPAGFISISASIFLWIFTLSEIYNFIVSKVTQFQAVGIHSIYGSGFSFNLFYIDTKAYLFISILLYALMISAIIRSRNMMFGRNYLSWDIIVFIVVYSFIAPVWLLKSVWNALRSREGSWTSERDYSLIKKVS